MADQDSSGMEGLADRLLAHARAVGEDRRIDDIYEAADAFFRVLDRLGKSRETSIARTKTEEAVMWAVKGVTK